MIENKLWLLKEVSINHTNHWIGAGMVSGVSIIWLRPFQTPIRDGTLYSTKNTYSLVYIIHFQPCI